MSTCELVVTKSLGLLDSKGGYLPPMAHKLVLFAIGKVDPKKPLPKEMKISAHEFASALDIPQNHAYGHLQDALNKLWESEVEWDEKDWKVRSRWIQERGEKLKGEGAISLVWSDKVHSGLVNIRNGFKSYQLRNIAKLDTSHAIRLYEILIRYKDTGWRVLPIDELKAMLGIPDKYPLMNDFKRYVVEPTLKQLNAKTNMKVEYSVQKNGRKITHLMFKFSLENQLKLALDGQIDKKTKGKAGVELDENSKKLIEEFGNKSNEK
jgi:plasmid replication initiation protein